MTNVLGVSSLDFLCFGEFIKLRITVCFSRDALPLFLLRGDVLSVVLPRGERFGPGAVVFNLVSESFMVKCPPLLPDSYVMHMVKLRY